MSRKLAIVAVALALGLGWAIRGHFGHEHGAAWAGGMAGLAILFAAKRKDWNLRMPTLTALAAVGWGIGGMMSYGLIVGMGRADDFGNVFYGLSMLAVIGGLYGYFGGGLFGLGLESSEQKKPNWPALLTEMMAGGLLAWYVLIAQFEWKMTPPRSELWAACLGAAVALTWYLQRNGFSRSLRVAGYGALGAGFGFSFGNFLQTLGTVSGGAFNWWNVMEFSLGFFGGLGMSYAVFTRDWPETSAPSKFANWLALIFLLFALPATNIFQAFEIKEFTQMAERVGLADPVTFAHRQMILGWLIVAAFTISGVLIWNSVQGKPAKLIRLGVPLFFFGYSIYYLIFSHIKKGFFLPSLGLQLEQYFYWVILAGIIAIWLLSLKKEAADMLVAGAKETWLRWVILVVGLLLVIFVITEISVNIHGEMPGAQHRFSIGN